MKVRFDFGARTVLTQSSYEDNEFLAHVQQGPFRLSAPLCLHFF